jgi:hypothetical protein
MASVPGALYAEASSALIPGSILSGPHDLLEESDAEHRAKQSPSVLIRECFGPTTPKSIEPRLIRSMCTDSPSRGWESPNPA